MLTYFAKYVNLNGQVCQHTFFRHFRFFGREPDKNFHFARNYLLFHPLVNLKKKGISLISKIRIQYPPLGLSINTSELINRLSVYKKAPKKIIMEIHDPTYLVCL